VLDRTGVDAFGKRDQCGLGRVCDALDVQGCLLRVSAAASWRKQLCALPEGSRRPSRRRVLLDLGDNHRRGFAVGRRHCSSSHGGRSSRVIEFRLRRVSDVVAQYAMKPDLA
jgi:hypothetical protein